MTQRYTIAHRGLKEGTHEFEWKIGDDFWEGRGESGVKGGEVDVRAVLERGPGGANAAMRLAVEMKGSVTVSCDRCLEDCLLPVRVTERLAVKLAESDEMPAFEGDVLWLNPADAAIDLEQYIYESVVLSLPLQRVHPEDVHGRPLCNPAMLERFTIVSEDEFEKLQSLKS
ncbi:MAG: DUF177 domain-containing protein [Alistipes sp.]|jgi:uncharacterized metal-binding protein YceD (DUF177 family)|nr:DUF177 domain-containing protein [Alistipes sp.]